MTENQSRTLVVFGAGASFDCHKNRARIGPPLTKDIPVAIRRYSSRCSALVDFLEAAIESAAKAGQSFDFESCLRSLWSSYKDDIVLANQFENLRYALCNLIEERQQTIVGDQKEDNLYTSLFNKFLLSRNRLSGERAMTVINMNYDVIAECSLNNRIPFEKFEDYYETIKRPISLYHPHGSIRWVETNLPEGLNLRKEIHSSSTRGTDLILRPGMNGYPPALALPMSGDFGGKTVWPADHLLRLQDELKLVDELIVVGWRAADAHILSLIAENVGSIRRLTIVGINRLDCVEIGDRIRRAVGPGAMDVVIEEHGFRAFILGNGGSDPLVDSLFQPQINPRSRF